MQNREQSKFEKEYSEKGFWEKIAKFAKDAGKELIYMALKLYYAYHEPDTPVWAKSTIVAALGYFISPIDAIPDVTPIVGYTDDLGVLTMALAAVASYINEDVKRKAKKKLNDWFG